MESQSSGEIQHVSEAVKFCFVLHEHAIAICAAPRNPTTFAFAVRMRYVHYVYLKHSFVAFAVRVRYVHCVSFFFLKKKGSFVARLHVTCVPLERPLHVPFAFNIFIVCI